MSQQKMRIYACGGAGTNLAHAAIEDETYSKNNKNFAEIMIGYIDSSDSNRFIDVDDGQILRMTGTYGSGKYRAENADQALSESFRDEIFRRFPAGDINIVMHGAGGGTGAVVAYGITKHLVEQDKPVIAIAVGSRVTNTDLQNTLKTIKSYDSIVEATKKPVTLFYRENSFDITRSQVDEDVHNAILSLAVLFSGNNRELDLQDLYHWLRYDRLGTTMPTELNQLVIVDFDGYSTLPVADITTVATIVTPDQSSNLKPPPETQFVGYFTEKQSEPEIAAQFPQNFVLVRSYFKKLKEMLLTDIGQHDQIASERVRNASLLDKGDKRHDSGCVL